jgi:hypothetical protein
MDALVHDFNTALDETTAGSNSSDRSNTARRKVGRGGETKGSQVWIRILYCCDFGIGLDPDTTSLVHSLGLK